MPFWIRGFKPKDLNYICKSCCRVLSTKVKPVRTRFAPSPTGFVHLGSLRTALYNYLWARKTGGQFILRLEDTDRTRQVEGSAENLYETLKWAGLSHDEGPDVGGPSGPYIQSQRTDIYRTHIEMLLKSDHVYRCFCSSERLVELRLASRRHGMSGTYDRKCFHMSKQQSADRAAAGEGYVVRLKTPQNYPVVDDIVHGRVQFHGTKGRTLAFDDPVLMKSDQFPTYHFANVVDDHLMEITHVIRGEEWLPSTPKHLALYDAFGWQPPQFAHVPLLANLSGAKLSKRHGDVNVKDYVKKGYLPESILNYLALMGWNCRQENEVMSMDDMVRLFDLSDITKGSAVVTPAKLNYLQKQHYITKSQTTIGLNELLRITKPFLQERFGRNLANFSDDYIKQVILSLRERLVEPSGLPELGACYFEEPSYQENESIQFVKKWKEDATLGN